LTVRPALRSMGKRLRASRACTRTRRTSWAWT